MLSRFLFLACAGVALNCSDVCDRATDIGDECETVSIVFEEECSGRAKEYAKCVVKNKDVACESFTAAQDTPLDECIAGLEDSEDSGE